MPTGGGGGGGVSGWPLTFFTYSLVTSPATLPGANNVWVTGFPLGYKLTFSHIDTFVNTSDLIGLYDMGIYNPAGTLLANIGAQHLSATGSVSFATVQGSLTLNPGLYLFGWTGNATTGQIFNAATTGCWVTNSNIATSSGGAMPASIGAVSVAPDRGALYCQLH